MHLKAQVLLEKASSWREIWSTFLMRHSMCTLATRLANIISSIMVPIFPRILFPMPVLTCRESCPQLPSTYFACAVSVKVNMLTQAPVSIWKHLDGRVVTPPCLGGERKGIRAKVKLACHRYFLKRFMWHSSQERHKKSHKNARTALPSPLYSIHYYFGSLGISWHTGERIVLLHSGLGRG